MLRHGLTGPLKPSQSEEPSNGDGCRLVVRPAMPAPLGIVARRDSVEIGFFSHISSAHGVPLISILRDAVSPATIAWAIIAIVIDPIKGHAFGSWPHVRKKCAGVGQPSITDRNASTAPIRVIPIARVEAPAPHGIVGLKFRRDAAARFAVRLFARRSALFLKAAAACSMPRAQLVCRCSGRAAAFTRTVPEQLATTFWLGHFGNHCQSPKPHTNQIRLCRHGNTPLERGTCY